MFNKIINCFKKIIFSILLLYGFNIVISSINLIIPINFISVISISILGVPALFALIAIYYIIY